MKISEYEKQHKEEISIANLKRTDFLKRLNQIVAKENQKLHKQYFGSKQKDADEDMNMENLEDLELDRLEMMLSLNLNQQNADMQDGHGQNGPQDGGLGNQKHNLLPSYRPYIYQLYEKDQLKYNDDYLQFQVKKDQNAEVLAGGSYYKGEKWYYYQQKCLRELRNGF